MYASNEEVKLAEALGYRHVCSVQQGSRFVRDLEQGSRHIWPTRAGWQTANLYRGSYQDHKLYPAGDLAGALLRDAGTP